MKGMSRVTFMILLRDDAETFVEYGGESVG